MAGLPCVPRKKMTALHLTPCKIRKIIRSNLVSCNLCSKPPRSIKSSQADLSRTFLQIQPPDYIYSRALFGVSRESSLLTPKIYS
jgi:hypothetical protein